MRQLKSQKTITSQLSNIEGFLKELQAQAEAKQDPSTGLDPEFNWINVNALLLIGILNCQGSDTDNAEVFYRIVQPAMKPRVTSFDKDLRKTLVFMVNMSTILYIM